MLDGKLLYMAVPRLADDLPFYVLDPARLAVPPAEAVSREGAACAAQKVSVGQMRRVQLVVCGSVTVNRAGARLGKGAGYSDIEVALLTEAGLIGPSTVIVTTVHPLQVIDGPLPETGHDFHRRPHQSLDMACPAEGFRPSSGDDVGLALWAADLEPVTTLTQGPAVSPVAAEPMSWPDAIEVDRVVPPSGKMTIGPQQFWLGTSRAGQSVSFWIDTTTVHMSIGGWRIKTVPSRLSAVDLARLRNAGAKAAGPPPAGHAPGVLAATSCVEVQRLVNSAGIITLGGQVIQVGSPLAGQRDRIRLDGQVMHVITQDGILWRTLACPIPPDQRHRIQGVRLAGPDPLPASRLTIQRKVSSRGGIQVARQRIQVGISHAGQTVTVELGDTTVQVIDQHGELITIVPRNSTGEISRFKAYGSRRRTEAVLDPSAVGVVHEASGQRDAVSGAVARDKPGDIRWSSRDNGRRGGGRGRRRA
ncbi:MAG: hypothetical protein QOG05_4862 [Streptosporangiaceae bacterium]|nr:hypothetical protein [Streptosporangiaceae bacterium]